MFSILIGLKRDGQLLPRLLGLLHGDAPPALKGLTLGFTGTGERYRAPPDHHEPRSPGSGASGCSGRHGVTRATHPPALRVAPGPALAAASCAPRRRPGALPGAGALAVPRAR